MKKQKARKKLDMQLFPKMAKRGSDLFKMGKRSKGKKGKKLIIGF